MRTVEVSYIGTAVLSHPDSGADVRTPSLEQRIERKLRRRKGDVFLRKDFASEGGYDQVGRALRALTRKGRLIRIGYGLYIRAAPSVFDGRPAPVKGIRSLAEEAVGRLGAKAYPSSLTRAYNEGRTTQVPSGRVIAVDKRMRRKIGVNGIYVKFERAATDAK